ncbi:hypothetical protein DKT77_12260 [Meridianimarinicoccus roseus]|uniref:DSBA-like thioredoxin domain-containing protein n=1 Tax=Meridianimarinicoccus roseus TaxID=2072018 RepID=A0A2V2LA75_9RHOB|nr:DsbA family protein [Meridianimarinicoccus roseus]PWR02318.1 hypothetical protein DKT77_12260 [Meridianimarinicoccus roseus]
MTAPQPSGPAHDAPRKGRRGLLVFGAAALGLLALPRLWQRLAPLPGLEPHPDVQGFTRLPNGAVTGPNPFAGLGEADPDAIAPAAMPAPGPALCAALFRDGIAPGTVPLAFFTDINCPYCRTMERWLPDLAPGSVSMTWHDLPLLGQASRSAARAVAAAALQDKGDAMRARLHRARLQPDPAYIAQLADGLGIDGPELLAAMDSPPVTARVAQSLGLARGFGIPGTPALVIGGTLAVGQRPEPEVARMVDAAARDDIPCA